MDEAWIRVVVYVLTTIVMVGVSVVFVLPKILENFVIERVKFKHQLRLKETESSLQIYAIF